MKKVLFIGQCNNGSTSRMRYEQIKEYFGANAQISLIDTSIIISGTKRILRSIGWRLKIGPMIKNLNKQVLLEIEKSNEGYKLIWVEKGVFLYPSTVIKLKKKTNNLVHYTPDPAFLYHKSRYFKNSVAIYDHCITTKTFELENYKKNNCKNLIYCTQGYDQQLHKSYFTFDEKKYDVSFIGHFEKNRASIIKKLIDNDIIVVLAGIKWEKFVKENFGNKNLCYLGRSIMGEEYAKIISQSRISLGLLSKWIPEKHTTRTFEIPACGTALLTERNEETAQYFSPKEALFYDNENEILEIIQNNLKNPISLRDTSFLGQNKVNSNNYSHSKIIHFILEKVLKN